MNKEYRKCINDPVYFMEHYCIILSNKGNKQIKLNEAQKLFINKFLIKYF